MRGMGPEMGSALCGGFGLCVLSCGDSALDPCPAQCLPACTGRMGCLGELGRGESALHCQEERPSPPQHRDWDPAGRPHEQGLLSEAQDLFSARGLRCPQGRLCFPVPPWGTWMDFLSTGRFLCGHGRRHAGPAAPSRPLGQKAL